MRQFVSLLAIMLFLGACAHSPEISNSTSQEYYKVMPGESMETIARALNIPHEVLRRSNPWLDPVRIKPEMKLLIPSREAILKYEVVERNSRQQLLNLNGHIWPIRNVSISSHYGQRNGRMHRGIDLRASQGTPIYATAAGVIVKSGRNGAYGNIVVIDHGQGIHTAYAHNKINLVRKKQRVVQGEVIAKVGTTGRSTGPHVHYEIRRNGKAINPSKHLDVGL